MVGHPMDPRWERGDYGVCHLEVRKLANIGDLVFDVVYPEGILGKRIIRSVFKVERKENEILKFRTFYFLDGGADKAVSSENFKIPPRYNKRLGPEETKELCSAISNSSSYNLYKVGERPESVSKEEWEEMIKRAREKDNEEQCKEQSD